MKLKEIFTLNNIITVAVCGITAIATYMAVKDLNDKLRGVCEQLDKSVDDLMKTDAHIEVSQDLVESVCRRKIEREVEYRMEKAVKSGVKEAAASITDEVRREINDQYNDIRSDVRREVEKQVGTIDISDIKKQVIRDAKEEATRKFKSDLDNVLDKYNDQLDDISTVYASIAKKFKD